MGMCLRSGPHMQKASTRAWIFARAIIMTSTTNTAGHVLGAQLKWGGIQSLLMLQQWCVGIVVENLFELYKIIKSDCCYLREMMERGGTFGRDCRVEADSA
jgi:hypothetical protein